VFQVTVFQHALAGAKKRLKKKPSYVLEALFVSVLLCKDHSTKVVLEEFSHDSTFKETPFRQ